MVEKKSLDINHEKINKSRSPFLSLVHSKSTRKNPFSILINSILFNSILINSILIFGIFSTRHYKSVVEKKNLDINREKINKSPPRSSLSSLVSKSTRKNLFSNFWNIFDIINQWLKKKSRYQKINKLIKINKFSFSFSRLFKIDSKKFVF